MVRAGVLSAALIALAWGQAGPAAAPAPGTPAPETPAPAAPAPGTPARAAPAPGTPDRPPGTAAPGISPASCLESGDGYFRATLAGDIEATIDWPNAGTRCEGEARSNPPGVRMSFQRAVHTRPDLLFVFGLTGIQAGQPAHAVGANLTIIVQGTPRIFGTLGDSRCTVDSLTQTRLKAQGAYRVEARGFCTQPAHAVRGSGSVLMNTFEFAGIVNYGEEGNPLTAGLGGVQSDLEQARPVLAGDE